MREAAEDLPGGHVEGDVEELGDTVAGTDAEAARLGEQQVGDVAVGDLHAVRAAGGAGGEQDVGAVVAGDARARGRGVRQGFVERDQGVAVRERDAVGVFGGGEDDPGPGGADDVGELGRGREADVLRDVGGAGLQDAEQADQHRDRAADEQADVVAGPYALADQAGGEGVGVPVELGVGDAGALVFGGHGVRGGRGVPGDGVVQEGVGDGDDGAPAVLPEEVLVMGGQMAQRHDRVASWLFRGSDCHSGGAAVDAAVSGGHARVSNAVRSRASAARSESVVLLLQHSTRPDRPRKERNEPHVTFSVTRATCVPVGDDLKVARPVPHAGGATAGRSPSRPRNREPSRT